MEDNIQSIIVTHKDGSTREYDKSFFAVATQDNADMCLAVSCNVAFVMMGSAALCASTLRSAYVNGNMSRGERWYCTAMFIRDWLRALFTAMKEEPNE